MNQNFDVCRVSECANRIKVKIHRLCNPHYLQMLKGKEFTKPKNRRPPANPDTLCAFESCKKEIYRNGGRGFCNIHYYQIKNGQELKPQGWFKISEDIRFIDQTKLCLACNEYKLFDDFNKQTRRPGGINDTCRKCTKKRFYESRYQKTFSYLEALLEHQNNKCSICLRDIKFSLDGRGIKNEDRSSSCVDHDRKCCPGDKSCGDCVRGILCFRCNSAIGLLEDSVEHLSRAIKYLDAAPLSGEF